MSTPYELLAGLALLREKKRLTGYSSDTQLESWPALLVRIGEMTCVLRQGDVDEIIARGKLSRVKGVADCVLGLGYFRGKLLTVLDGALLLGLHNEHRRSDTSARIMVVNGADEWFGLQVDELLGIRHVWSDDTYDNAAAEQVDAVWATHVECWIKLEKNIVPVIQIKRLVQALEQDDGTVIPPQ